MVLSLDIINDLLFNAVKIAIIAYSVMAIAATSHDSSAACRHRMLLFALAACISLPILSHRLPVIALPVVPAFVADSAQIEFSSLASVTHYPIISLLIGVYALLSLGFFSKLISGLWQLRALGQSATIIPIESLPEASHQQLAELRRPVKLLAARALRTPMIWGLLHPKLALPHSYSQWNEPCLRHVLLHELAHLRRGDWATTLFAHAVVCLLWPLACIWTLRKQLLWYAEVACDDQVLSAGVSRPDYAASLLSFTQTSPAGLPGNSLIDPTQVFRRIHTVLDGARIYQSSQLPPLALACIGLLLLLPVSALKLTPLEAGTDSAIHLLPLQITLPAQPIKSAPADSTDRDLRSLKSNLLIDAKDAPVNPKHRWSLDIPPAPVEADQFQTPWQPQPIPLDAPPHNTVRVLPVYPKRALLRGREGHVTVEFDITSRGTVVNEQVVEASPPGLFDDAALEALRQYRYSLGYDKEQETIVQRRREIFRFSLNEDAKLNQDQ